MIGYTVQCKRTKKYGVILSVSGTTLYIAFLDNSFGYREVHEVTLIDNRGA